MRLSHRRFGRSRARSFRNRAVAAWAFALLGVASSGAGTLTVVTTADSGSGSLRSVINTAGAGDTIVFNIPTSAAGYEPSTRTFTITLAGATPGTKTLFIGKDLTIDGSGQKIVVRRSSAAGTPNFRIFDITAGTVVLSHLTIANGNSAIGNGSTTDNGGGIRNAANLTVRNCTFTGNTSGDYGSGGAIMNQAVLLVESSTFSGNSCGFGDGGAIENSGGAAPQATIRSSTFTANSALEGGALDNFADMTVQGCTVTGNAAADKTFTSQGGGGISNHGQGIKIQNTIVVGNSAPRGGADTRGSFSSFGYNLVGDISNSFGFIAAADQTNVTAAQAKLAPLADYGGPTFTMPPIAGSYAIDKGSSHDLIDGADVASDQRGLPRLVDRLEPNAANTGYGDGADIGAAELGLPQAGPTFTVTTTIERTRGVCTTDNCSLIDALNLANAVDDANTINFSPGLTGAIGTAVLTPSGLAITKPVTIEGPGARKLTITGRTAARVFRVTGFNVTISGLTIVNGRVNSDNGGAIHNTGGLTLERCAIVNGVASGGFGGGVYNASGATLDVNACTISGSSAQLGGGIYNDAILNVTNSTFSADTANNGGGLISRYNGGASNVHLRNCTVTACSASDPGTAGGSGGGGFYAEGNETQYFLVNSIFAGNSSAANPSTNPDVRGNFTSDGHNLIGNVGFSTGLANNVKDDQVGTPGAIKNAQLGPLQNNGGPTDTHALLENSSARDAGDDASAAFDGDQRGYTRIGTSDIGAFEYGGLPTTIANISTRLRVEAGDNALIGGFIVTGTQAKKLIVRALGPSLPVSAALGDPKLDIYDSAGQLIGSNNNWRESANAQEIADSGIPPSHDLEAAVLGSVNPGAYTAVVSGANGETGVGLVEVYDLNRAADSELANISTRGLVEAGDDVMIGGFIVQGAQDQKVIVRALGPSLPVSDRLLNPQLELYDAFGTLVRSNNDWRTEQASEIIAAGVAPTDEAESAIVGTLSPGSYTAIVRGVNGTTGVGLIEVYALD